MLSLSSLIWKRFIFQGISLLNCDVIDKVLTVDDYKSAKKLKLLVNEVVKYKPG